MLRVDGTYVTPQGKREYIIASYESSKVAEIFIKFVVHVRLQGKLAFRRKSVHARYLNYNNQ